MARVKRGVQARRRHKKVLKLAKDSTLSRLITLVKEAETQKSPTQQLTDKFERYFVPSVLILVGILLFAFLVIDILLFGKIVHGEFFPDVL